MTRAATGLGKAIARGDLLVLIYRLLRGKVNLEDEGF